MAVSEVDTSIECVFANDGIEALQQLDEDGFLPDCIFIDLNMPRMNGLECLAVIKKIERLQKVPVFIYSTSADPKLVAECKQMGASDFIVKPPGLQLLTDKLKQIIQHN